ncbi:MAG TPA: sigma 54-interacting transcriptional regulator [Candidatus Acidoferrales bacterium]|jgi:formate hydrogenlyase transcriptional activator|nr:sigma 54-interacting transcriptional regulator [Candidatus Acidoferrales bacterium]
MSNRSEILAATLPETRYETLIRVSNAIGTYRDPQDLFRALVRELHRVVQFDNVGVSIYDEKSNTFHRHFVDAETEAAIPPDPELTMEESDAWWVYQNQETLVTSLADHHAQICKFREILKKYGISSVCTLPLTTAHSKVGALTFASKAPDVYTAEEVHFLSVVAEQIALAFDNALHFDAAQASQQQLLKKSERVGLLLELTNHLVSNLDFRDLLRAAAASTRRVMGCDGVGITLPDTDNIHLRIYALDFPLIDESVQEESLVRIDEDVSGAVFRTGKLWCGSVQEARRLGMKDTAQAEVGTVCVLPLVSRSRVLGVFGVIKYQDNAFAGDDIKFLAQIANQVAIAVENALAFGEIRELKDKLAQEKLYLEDEIRSEMNFAQIVGNSVPLRKVLKRVETVAPTDSTVLIYGETGTGKELIARAIHDLSPRRSKPFVKLNCAAIPTGLLESELFGHEKGAFTGAIAQRIGRFEVANGGTIFLDEIGEVPLELQTKLLRVLQEREFERLGSSRTLRTDARLIAATNRDLEAMVSEQKFRSDLFFRLNVFPVDVPPLREREGDIPLLVRQFAQQFSRRMSKEIETIPSATMDALCRYHWPGNIRELQNVIERAVIISTGPTLNVDVADLKSPKFSHPLEKLESPKSSPNGALHDVLEQSERQQILKALEQCNWVVAGPKGAAALLAMKRSTLQQRIRKLGIARHPA